MRFLTYRSTPDYRAAWVATDGRSALFTTSANAEQIKGLSLAACRGVKVQTLFEALQDRASEFLALVSSQEEPYEQS